MRGGHKQVCQTLLASGAAVDALEWHTGWSAMHWAARCGDPDIIQLLADSGADIDLPDAYGRSPLCAPCSRSSAAYSGFKF